VRTSWNIRVVVALAACAVGCGSKVAAPTRTAPDADTEGDATPDAATPTPTTSGVVLFGGIPVQGTFSNDTWTYSGQTWSQAPSSGSGPSAREDAAMAPWNGGAVLFGGDDIATTSDLDTALGDTWSWNGGSWTQLDVTGPSPRTAHAMAPLGDDTVVLFGGDILDATNGTVNGQPLGDTWVFDGGWSQRSVPGPSARHGHAMATLNGVVVLFGGADESGVLGDTWTFDGAKWTQENVKGPSARSSHAMATLNGKVMLFGGLDGAADPLGDTWTWDGLAWTEESGPGPSPRFSHAMATTESAVVLYGGVTFDVGLALPAGTSTWLWNGASWTQEQTGGPGPLDAHAMSAW
jgi:hypothetical protein